LDSFKNIVAEAKRFELLDPFEPLVFKTSAIDHSAKLPYMVDAVRFELTQNKRGGYSSLGSPMPSTSIFGGGGWIRTTALFTEQIYSLPPSATRPRLQNLVTLSSMILDSVMG
jgi:hypothetical protein